MLKFGSHYTDFSLYITEVFNKCYPGVDTEKHYRKHSATQANNCVPAKVENKFGRFFLTQRKINFGRNYYLLEADVQRLKLAHEIKHSGTTFRRLSCPAGAR